MTEIPDDIRAYQEPLDDESRAICAVLLETIERGLPGFERKVWHAHPVWFDNGNPNVGYDKLKSSLRVIFWTGQSFPTPGLNPEGSFKAAERRFVSPDEIDTELLSRRLAEAREIQWNYRDIRTARLPSASPRSGEDPSRPVGGGCQVARTRRATRQVRPRPKVRRLPRECPPFGQR